MSLYEGIQNFFGLLQLIIIARILLTWFPNINWQYQPFKFLREFTDPILEPFRKLVPPIGGIDISPIILFVVLGIAEKVVLSILYMI